MNILLTEQAKREVLKFMDAEKVSMSNGGLRIGVMPGGCSGFKYNMLVEDMPADDDLVIESNGIHVFVDPFSAPYLDGVSIDYVTSMQGSGFTFQNPNSTGGCGCNNSFSI